MQKNLGKNLKCSNLELIDIRSKYFTFVTYSSDWKGLPFTEIHTAVGTTVLI
jgi:hypothetical protein